MGILPVKKSKNQVKLDKIKELQDEADRDFIEGVYKHDNLNSDTAAMGIDVNVLRAKQGAINTIVESMDEDKNFVSQFAEKAASMYTEREILYMFSKLSFVKMMEEFHAKGGNRATPQQPQPQQPVEEQAEKGSDEIDNYLDNLGQ